MGLRPVWHLAIIVFVYINCQLFIENKYTVSKNAPTLKRYSSKLSNQVKSNQIY